MRPKHVGGLIWQSLTALFAIGKHEVVVPPTSGQMLALVANQRASVVRQSGPPDTSFSRNPALAAERAKTSADPPLIV
jgi:hypothetical protein